MTVQTEIKDLIAAYEASADMDTLHRRAAAVGLIKGADLLLDGKQATSAEREVIIEFKKRVGREVFGITSWRAEESVSVGVQTPMADALAKPPTRYDTMPGHPLAGVPQEALDAATEALRTAATPVQSLSATNYLAEVGQVIDVEDGDFEPVAHAVLAAALSKLEKR